MSDRTVGALPPLPPPVRGGVASLPPLPAGDLQTYHNASEHGTQEALERMGLPTGKDRREVDEQAERQLFWRLLNVTIEQVLADQLRDELFSQPIRQTLLTRLRTLRRELGTNVSIESFRNHILQRTRLQGQIPGLLYELSQIEESTTGRSYTELLAVLERTYKTRTIAQLIFRECSHRYEQGEEIDSLTVFIEKLLIEVGQGAKPKRRKFSDLARSVHNQIKEPDRTKPSLQIGLPDFDMQFGGIKRDRVITIGGFTGSGKTAMLIDLIYRLLWYHRDKIAIKFFSLEMSEERVMQRLFSRAAMVAVKRQDDWWVKVSYENDEEGKPIEVELMEDLTPDEIRRLDNALPFFEQLDDVIDIEYTQLTAESLASGSRQFALEHPDKHLIIMYDHMGLFDKEGNDNRKEFDNIINASKNVARTTKATIFPLVQLDKSVESRFNKAEYYRPGSTNIMETVGIEAASDIVLLLWRPHKFFEQIPYMHPGLGIYSQDESDESNWWDCRHRMIVIVAKNRDGTAPNDMVFDADMGHNKLYRYNELRKENPGLFGKLILETAQEVRTELDFAQGKGLPAPRRENPDELPF
jgi:replicative DNA helicase